MKSQNLFFGENKKKKNQNLSAEDFIQHTKSEKAPCFQTFCCYAPACCRQQWSI